MDKEKQKAAGGDEDLSAIKKSLQDGTAVVGARTVLKRLQEGNISKVYLAANCPGKLQGDIQSYAGLVNTPVVFLRITNEELGILCKKNFFVAVVGIHR